MNEQLFCNTINRTSKELNINPLLLLSGIEGLYTFKDVHLNALNFEFLDSLILTLFALRIGDKFHSVAEEHLASPDKAVRNAAGVQLSELSNDAIARSSNPYLQSFANILNGKSIIRKYHEKALEVAALEIKKTQLLFKNNSITTIMLAICKNDLKESLNFGNVFQS